MHDDLRSAFKKAVLKALPVLDDLVRQSSQPYLVWRKRSDGNWLGEYEERPDLVSVYAAADKELHDAAAEFASLFFREHPQFEGLVGFARFATRFGNDKSRMIRAAASCLWAKHGTFAYDESSVDVIADEFVEFVTNPSVRFRFQAQLVNYRMTVPTLDLPTDLVIRQLGEQEVTALHGGSPESVGLLRPKYSGIHEFVIEGEHDEEKLFGNPPDNGVHPIDSVKARLDRAILSLRTFKEGRVGYDFVNFNALKFCPLGMPSLGWGDAYVPVGRYEIRDDEIGPLKEHAGRILALSEPAMEMACSRLADAETRSRHEDRLVDAVIGMEALLLAGLRAEERKGELRYRFSLHYSTMFDSPEERYRAFRVAKNLYDLRSTIAHGGNLPGHSVRVGREQLTLADAAKRATAALRTVIGTFLPRVKDTPYKKPQFWERAYFRLDNYEDD